MLGYSLKTIIQASVLKMPTRSRGLEVDVPLCVEEICVAAK